MKKNHSFCPTEIIFALTGACNLNCSHCYTNKNPTKLSIKDAINFLESCKNTTIQNVGFSGGGEPFLYFDFLKDIVSYCVKNDFFFDRIMTNGVWWQNQEDLNLKLQQLYDCGYDGKFGLSWDSYHGQTTEKIFTFIKSVHSIFGKQSVEIQSVIANSKNTNDKQNPNDLQKFTELANLLNSNISVQTNKKTGKGLIIIENENLFIPIWRERQTLQSNLPEAWTSKKWFKDDYCQGPGQILFVHPDGNISPCCGFANENPELFIGTIKETFLSIMNNSKQNRMVQICYNEGLSKQIKVLKKQKKLIGRTDDLCTFCDYICKVKN